MEHPSKGRTGNKVRTYLLYAFGEILLVMIGILLALQVNNWRDQVNRNTKEVEVVKLLIRDLKVDKGDLDYFTTRLDRQESATINAMKALREANEDSLLKYIGTATNIWNYRPSYPTYLGLKQSGNLEIISDTEVLDKVIYYHDTVVDYLDDLREGYKQLVLESDEALRPYMGPVWIEADSTWKWGGVGNIGELSKNDEVLHLMGELGFRRSSLANRIHTLFIPENDTLMIMLDNYLKEIES